MKICEMWIGNVWNLIGMLKVWNLIGGIGFLSGFELGILCLFDKLRVFLMIGIIGEKGCFYLIILRWK